MYQTQGPAGTGEKKPYEVQQHQQPLLSKIRNFNQFNLPSFGSLFSGNISSKAKTGKQDARIVSDSEAPDSSFELCQLEKGTQQTPSSFGANSDSQPLPDCTTCPTLAASNVDLSSCGVSCNQYQMGNCSSAKRYDATMSNTAQKTPHTFTRFPEMRVPFGNISSSDSGFPLALGNSRRFDPHNCGDSAASPQSISSSDPLAYTPVFPSLSSSMHGSVLLDPFESQSASRQQGLGLYGESGTPPLTPDSLTNGFLSLDLLTDASLPSFSQFSFSVDSLNGSDEILNNYDTEGSVYNGRSLREIKEGKKPERTVDHTINGDSEPCNASDNPEEWYGLEYTLEVSSRDRQPSESQSFCVGEHSKSRASWAALHKGTIHPFFEDEDYRQWKNWHHFLDRQDEKKRHKKGFEFKHRSKELAWLYVDEIRTRDVLYWQKEVFGVVARDVKERLQFLVERRPDPYHPPQEHNWPWYLKRSRSVACLRELEPKPPVGVDRRL